MQISLMYLQYNELIQLAYKVIHYFFVVREVRMVMRLRPLSTLDGKMFVLAPLLKLFCSICSKSLKPGSSKNSLDSQQYST